MKKIFAIFLIAISIFTLFSCKTELETEINSDTSDKNAKAFVEIKSDNHVKKIIPEKSEIKLAVGESYRIEYTTIPENAENTLTFNTDNDCVSVDNDGNITAMAEGESIVTIISDNGITSEISVSTYLIPIDSLTFYGDITIGIGELVRPEYSIAPINASLSNLKWSSSDEDIFTVNDEGYLKGINKGTATLSALTTDGTEISESIEVNVTRGPYAPLSDIQPSRFSLENDKYTNNNDSMQAKIMLTGDNMALSAQQNAARTDNTFNFNESYDFVKNIFSKADFVIGNLETITSHSYPYTYEQKEAYGNPVCNAPATYLDAIRYAGYDAMVTANNHCSDAGKQGVIETNRMLDKYLIPHTGTFPSINDKRYMIFCVNGINVGILSYTELINNEWGYNDSDECKRILNRWSEEKTKKDINDLKQDGAEFIIVYNHWGSEYQQSPNSEQKKHAQIIADAGADLIIGSHTHCLQPASLIETADGRTVPCIYSMSNFISSMSQTMCNDTIILEVNIQKSNDNVEITDWGYIGCKVFSEFEGKKFVIVPTCPDLNGGYNNSALEDSAKRISEILGNEISEIKQSN